MSNLSRLEGFHARVFEGVNENRTHLSAVSAFEIHCLAGKLTFGDPFQDSGVVPPHCNLATLQANSFQPPLGAAPLIKHGGKNLVLSVLCVPNSLDSDWGLTHPSHIRPSVSWHLN